MQIDNDDLLYEYVLEELEKVEPIKGLWAKAIAHSEGKMKKQNHFICNTEFKQ